MMGILTGVFGSAILVGIAAAVAVLPTFSASLVYAICLVAMLGCSAATLLRSENAALLTTMIREEIDLKKVTLFRQPSQQAGEAASLTFNPHGLAGCYRGCSGYRG
jgi:hypothetical protein